MSNKSIQWIVAACIAGAMAFGSAAMAAEPAAHHHAPAHKIVHHKHHAAAHKMAHKKHHTNHKKHHVAPKKHHAAPKK